MNFQHDLGRRVSGQREIRQTIVQLLSNMSDGKEIRSYLNRFSHVDQARFAVIKVGGAILREDLETTAAALAFLHTVGLTPIVIHGGGPQLDDALAEAKVETPKIEGKRVTNADALDIARRVFVDENLKFVEAIRAQGVEAHSVNAGAIEADYLDKDKFGFVGEPTRVREDVIRSVVASGALPVITCLGVARGGQLVNINADAATRALVHALRPLKIIFLTGVGGLLGEDGQAIHSINLASDYDNLVSQPWVHSGMRLKLQEIKKLLADAPEETSVSITKPTGLIRELFTHGGSGTLIRKGERIVSIESKDQIDAGAVTRLVESAFRRRLKSDWWADLPFQMAHLSENYRAGAIVSRRDGYDYLDKFAVADAARGEGLSRTVWRRLVAASPRLFWRSRTANRFNAFYAQHADGSFKRGDWTVFWIGESDFAVIGKIVDQIAQMPESFEPGADDGAPQLLEDT
ncbi:MAG: acetylglutamate kinase [Pseudomonadota bacterium]